MSVQLLHNASFSLCRTNPKLSTNVKLYVDSSDMLYLESFDANSELSQSTFKGYKLDSSSSYDRDIYSFYNYGKFPKSLAYSVYQESEDISVFSDYAKQYETFYEAGAEFIVSKLYPEDIGVFAPIWLNDIIPNYFVIFRIDGPVTVNSKGVPTEAYYYDQIIDPNNFKNNVLNKCSIIKTYDLTDNSNIGKYLRNYKLKTDFPTSSMFFDPNKNKVSSWNGISYDRGGFINKSEIIYEKFTVADQSIIESEYFLTKGFERNGVVSANLINLEFLFNDNVTDYELNRYFGLYVNEIEEGTFALNSKKFYYNKNVDNTYENKKISSDFLLPTSKIDLTVTNTSGVVLYIDTDYTTVTDLPDSDTVNNLASIFYVKDKDENFHNLKNGSVWKINELKLSDTSINLNKLAGQTASCTSVKGELIDNLGKAYMILTVNSNIPYGYTIDFYDDNDTNTGINSFGQIAADTNLTVPGTANHIYFNPNGSTSEVAQSIVAAINNIESNSKVFSAVASDNIVILESKFGGSRFNALRIEINSNFIDEVISFYPTLTNYTSNFKGGTDKKNDRIKIKKENELYFSINNYVACKNGFGTVIGHEKCLEPVSISNGIPTSYKSTYDTYMILTIDRNDVSIDQEGMVSLYNQFVPTFGRFSIFPLKDFDFDFYSTEYSQQGELISEYDEYNQYDSITELPIGKSSHPDILEFYKRGFGKLQGLLTNDFDESLIQTEIESEYDRLYENYLLELSTISRSVPYINKWVYKDGKDIRNKDYRLNMSGAFGIYNFSPSNKNFKQDPDSFTHEWYLLSKYPDYFNLTSIDYNKIWSYFDSKVYDNSIAADGTFIDYGDFQNITEDKFTEYFIVDRLFYNNVYYPIDRQIRYSLFSGANTEKYAETFFRGIKVAIKRREDADADISNKLVINYNMNNLKYLKNQEFNGYKFSAILIPHDNDRPVDTAGTLYLQKSPFEIKIIENKKWKTITLIVFVDLNYYDFDNGRQFIDRTMLYSLKSNIIKNTSGDYDISNYSYTDTVMKGAIDLSTSSGSIGNYYVRGVPNIDGVPTDFYKDIKIGNDGLYNSITFTTVGTGAGTYVISKIKKIESTNLLIAGSITKNGTIIPFLPVYVPDSSTLATTTYNIIEGGFNQYIDMMEKASFANIYSYINYGDPNVIYETVDVDGTLSYDKFVLELISSNPVYTSLYANIIPDMDRPVQFNLIKTIGYRLVMSKSIDILPFYRHSGSYDPKFIDVFKFQDPYIENILLPDSYEEKVFDLTRYTNSNFKYTDTDFGKIKNYFYHKINEENTNNILELININSFQSKYPLIGEIGTDKKDKYIFESAWDSGYFNKNISKIDYTRVDGTRSMLEKKSFCGSKILSVPETLNIETFTYGLYDKDIENSSRSEMLLYEETDQKLTLYVNLKNNVVSNFNGYLNFLFSKYIDPRFSYGIKHSISDTIDKYVELNVLKRYAIYNINFFINETRGNGSSDYSYMLLDDDTKILNSLNPTMNFKTTRSTSNRYDFKIIFNKKPGNIYKYGLSVVIKKL